MVSFSIFLKGKEIVYTSSLSTEEKLKKAGFVHLLYAKGGIEGSGSGYMVRTGQDWLRENG
jgi:hypothetical protein